MNNISDIKDQLRYFDRIEGNEDEINDCISTLSRMLWIFTAYSTKFDKKSSNYGELVSDMIEIFNIFASNLNALLNKDEDILPKISYINLLSIIQAYVYLSINSQKLNLKSNINIDFIKDLEVIPEDNTIENYDKFLMFKEIVKKTMKNNYNLNMLDIDNMNLQKYELPMLLFPAYTRKINYKGSQKEQLIFINSPYDFFANTGNNTGFIRVRSNLCKDMNVLQLEIDFNEFMLINIDILKKDNFEALVNDYITMKIQ